MNEKDLKELRDSFADFDADDFFDVLEEMRIENREEELRRAKELEGLFDD